MGVRSGAACLGLVAVMMSGCGGSGHATGNGQGGSTGSLSRSAFVDQANAICKQANSARGKIARPTSASQLSTAVGQLASTMRGYLGQFQSLSARAPSNLKADYDQFVARVGQLIALLPPLAQAAKTNDLAKVTKLESQFQGIQNAGTAAAKRAQLGSACSS